MPTAVLAAAMLLRTLFAGVAELIPSGRCVMHVATFISMFEDGCDGGCGNECGGSGGGKS